MGDQTTAAQRRREQVDSWRLVRFMRLLQTTTRLIETMENRTPGIYAADAASVLAVKEEIVRSRQCLQGRG